MAETEKKQNFITPVNWMTMFDVGGGESSSFFQKNFITFTAYDPPNINYVATSSRDAMQPSGNRKDSYSFYYPKNSIKEDTTHAFSANEGLLADTLKSGLGIAKEALIGINVVGAVTGTGKGLRTTGILSDEATYFTHTEKRKFSIILDLYSTSNTQEDIYRPLLFFKKYSHAISVIDKGPDIIRFPSTFTITGGVFSNPAVMPHVKGSGLPFHLVLKNISVEYNTDVQFLDSLGYPLQARLALDFEEIKTLFQGDYPDDLNNPDLIKTKITITGGKK